MRLNNASTLRDTLDGLLAEKQDALWAHAQREDPVQLVHAYSAPRDQEIVALIASCLSYGQRKVFIPVIRRICQSLGGSPYDFVASGKARALDFDWFRYRFNKPDDLRCLFYGLERVVTSHGSLEAAFLSFPSSSAPFRDQLSAFVSLFREVDYTPVVGSPEGTKGFRYLLPAPEKGGACKRLNMFLRWLVRKEGVDLGIWEGICPSALVVPLDVHVQRVSRALGLTAKTGSTWKVAEDITHSLSQLDPSDPLKYDFLLFSLGAWGDLPKELL